MKAIYLCILPLLLFTACEKKHITKFPIISNANLEKLDWRDIKGFQTDDLDLALDVFKKDCKASYKNIHLKDVCTKVLKTLNGKSFFKSNFTPYKLLDNSNNRKGLITGYYEPILKGSFKKNSIYKYPIYKTPKDLISVNLNKLYPELKYYRLRGKIVNNVLLPYDTREEIKSKENLEPLLYLDNKVDKFFLEIQGSGKVQLDNNKTIHVAYANQNGRKYYPIGRKLIEDGIIKKEDMSLQAIKKWCHLHPDKVDQLFNLNQSVIFFTITDKPATGSLGIPLIAQRNIAVDRKFIPLGYPVFLNTTDPITKKSIDTLVIAADTGGVIKGEVRADLFWGNGKIAEQKAGKMAQKGELTILIPNNYLDKINDIEAKLLKAKVN